MGYVYEDGKEYPRAGVYRRSSNGNVNNTVASALDGIGVLPIKSDWGPLNEVTIHEIGTSDVTMKNTYGTGGTMSVAEAYMDGGLDKLYLVRLGTGGKSGKIELKSNETKAVTLTLKYPGTHEFTVSVRDKLGAESTRELVIYDGAKEVETITFASGTGEPKALEKAVEDIQSNYITAKAEDGVTDAITDVSQQPFEGGENPTVTTADYSTAFEAFEPYYYNTIALDTVDADVQALLIEYINTSFKDGNLAIAVIGDKGSVDIKKRMDNASKIDNYPIVYFASDFINSDGETVSGPEAIAKAAGVIAATPSSKSIVRTEMPGAAKLTERLKNSQYENAVRNGLLLLSVNADGKVVFDSGVNTLINPDEEKQDNGWKKIKRAKVRHETFYRLDCEMDKLIGKVNGTKDGIANVIQRGQAVLDTMADEGKLIDPTFKLDTNKGYGADYGYFVVNAVDVDTLERIFIHYKWKYSENS